MDEHLKLALRAHEADGWHLVTTGVESSESILPKINAWCEDGCKFLGITYEDAPGAAPNGVWVTLIFATNNPRKIVPFRHRG